MRPDKKHTSRLEKKAAPRASRRGSGPGPAPGRKSDLLEEAITQMNAGKYGRSSGVLKELLTLDPNNQEAKRLFATLQLRIGSLVTARTAFESMVQEAMGRQDYWLAESLLREYLAAGPRCVPFLEMLGNVLEIKGDPDAAVKEYAKAVEILVEDPDPEHPHRAQDIYRKIVDLDPHSPAAFRLDSLLARGTETTPSSIASELGHRAPWQDLDSLTSSDESSSVEIPAAEPVFSAESAGVLPRLPWEDDGHDVELRPRPEESTDSSLTAMPAASVDAGASLLLDDRDSLPPVTESSTSTSDSVVTTSTIPSGSMQASMTDASAGHPDIEPSSELEPSTWAPLADSAPVMTVTDAGTQEIASTLAQSVSSLEELLARINKDISPSETAPDQSTISILDQPASGDVEDSPSPTLIGAAAVPPAGSNPTDKSSISAPMPWEQVEEQPIVVEPVREDPSSHRMNPEPAEMVTAPSSEETIISAPMPSEMAQEMPAVGAPAEESCKVGGAEHNDHLIADILQQADLREKLSTEAEAQRESINPRPAEEATIRKDPVSDPAPIRDLIDTAVVRELSPAQLEPPSYQDSAPADNLKEGLPESLSSAADVEAANTAPENLATAAAEEVEIAIEPAPPPAPRAVKEDASAGSIFPALLRLVGVSMEKPAESELPPAPVEVEQAITSEARQTAADEMAPSFLTSAEPAPSPDEGVAAVREVAAPEPSPVQEPLVESPVPADETTAGQSIPLVDLQPHSAEQIPPSDGEGGRAPEPGLPPCLPIELHHHAIDMSPSTTVTGEMEAHVAPATSEPPAKRKKDKKKKSRHASEAAQVASASDLPSPTPVAPDPLSVTESNLFHRGDAPVTHPTPSTPRPTAPPEATQPVQVLESPRPASISARSSEPVVIPSQIKSAPLHKSKSSFKAGGLVRRLWFRLSMAIHACFSTAHAVTVTAISMAALGIGVSVLAVGGLGLVWLAMEEKPNKAFQDLMSAVPQSSGDFKRSGYALFLGLGAPAQKDAVQAGMEHHAGQGNLADLKACLVIDRMSGLDTKSTSASALENWFRETQPTSTFTAKASLLKSWVTEASTALARYRQWTSLPFEDGGYGHRTGPDCGKTLYLHRLQVAEGFAQGQDQGIERVEADLAFWRSVLRKARTLGVKMLAVAALNDDARVISGLIMSTELDAKYLPRLARATVPLDQVELSMRWPMQNQFLMQKKNIEDALKNEQEEERPWYVAGVAAMPVPRQRILNDYAEYYVTLTRTTETSQEKFVPPNLYTQIHAPAAGVMDYVSNPINNLLGVETGPAWESYVGGIREADALLRLVSLQGWIRKTAQEGGGDVKARLAKAGPNFYDPFTGFPMLVNSAKGRLYSVGMNGKDDDGAPDRDVSVALPGHGSAGK